MTWLLLWPLPFVLLLLSGALIWRWRSGARGVPPERRESSVDEIVTAARLRDGPNGTLNGPFR